MLWWIFGYLAIGWCAGFWAAFFSNLDVMFMRENPPNLIRLTTLSGIMLLWPVLPFVRVLK